MKKITLISVLFALLLSLTTPSFTDETQSIQKPLIQMVILLDTSGSMDGLIEQAKTQLWKIVNEFIAAKREGVRPEIQVALYEYGKQSIPAAEGYLRMIVPLSTDLDKISEELFALKTDGGDEYCGRVIKAAVEGLAWSKLNDDLKVIFIAGNEPFTQGDVDYKEACRLAISKGIIVNTVFCGPHQEGIDTQWKDGAMLADGMYLNIDQNQQVVHIVSPQDQKIEELGKKLNETYIAYGQQGLLSKERQEEQDSNAQASAPGVMLERAVCKSSANYANESWDLCDAITSGRKLEEIPVEELPEEMKKMTLEERKAFLETKKKERESVQKEIQGLSDEREKFVAEKRREMSQVGENSFDVALIQILRNQASKKKYSWEK